MKKLFILSIILTLACSSAFACGMGGGDKDDVTTMGSGETSPTS